MLFVLSAALAGAFITEVGEDHALAVGGNWARAFPDGDDGWHFFWAAGGDYNLLPMTNDLYVEDRNRRQLSGHTDLVDSQIVPCPDGSWLHVGSSMVEEPDDTAWAFRYDADFDLVAEATLEHANTTMRMNDPALTCEGGGLDLVGAVTDDFRSTVYVLGPDGAAEERVDVRTWPMLQGGALAWDDEAGEVLALGYDLDRLVAVMRADRELNDLDEIQLDLSVGAERPYWPQGLMRVGNYWLIAHMSRDASAGWAADEGNVRLAVLDLDWNVLESVAVTAYGPPTGAMRPWITRRGEQLLVLYDISLTPHVVPVTLDLGAFGDGEPIDTGDPGSPGDSGGPDGDPEEREPYTPASACGCSSAGPASWWWVAGLLPLLRRRAGA